MGYDNKPWSKEWINEREIKFLTEGNLTSRNVTIFSDVGRQRFPGTPLFRETAPRLHSGLRATITFGDRLAREYARQVQLRSHGNAKAC